jgi:hypothetical protein
MLSTQNSIGNPTDVGLQLQQVPNSVFKELVSLAKMPSSNFESVSAKFAELQQQCSNRFDYNFPIQDGKKGELFSKVVEIKGQQAHRFVDEIKDCQFVNKNTDGYTRKIEINVPELPTFEERLFIKKQANGEITIIFVQNHDEDFFACLNHVHQDGGKWYWSGSYLYGELSNSAEVESKNKQQMFDSTYANMLKFLDDKSEFNRVYESLQNW